MTKPYTDPNWPALDTGTIDPPKVEPFSPAQRAELERVLLDIDCARDRLRQILERT